MTGDRASAGGAAMAGGERFQARVSAWYCARILLQTPDIAEEFDLPTTSIAERIYCETQDNTDDLRIEFSGNSYIYGQCKTSLSLSSAADSTWASVLTQFYLDLDKSALIGVEKRFVLFYQNSNKNLEKLSLLLKRYRQLPIGSPLVDAATNKAETDLVNDLNTLLDALQVNPDLPNLGVQREALLRHSYIKQLKLNVGEVDYLGIVDALQYGLLNTSTQIKQTLNSLHILADDLLAERGTSDRLSLRQRLLGEGIALKDSINYQADFEQLREWSAQELEHHTLRGRGQLRINGRTISIERPVVQAMFELAQEDSFLIAGGAGTGKSGCLLMLAQKLQEAGQRVWYWAADAVASQSLPQMENELRLEHTWAGILAEAASGIGATLIVDSLDSLRDAQTLQTYEKLFRFALCRGIKVIASIRSFDLQYSSELKEVFKEKITITELDEAEFSQVIEMVSEVQEAISSSPLLGSVIRNLFSLDLLCKLMSSGETAVQLSGISTQAELFDLYWEKRVLSNPIRSEIEHILKLLVEQMVSENKLQVVFAQPWTTQIENALFSPELLRHSPVLPGRLSSQSIEFGHHLLFDYVAERLFVRARRSQLVNELIRPDTWGLFLRPSLVLFHRYSWVQGRQDFWDTMLELERNAVPQIQKIPGYLVIAEEAKSYADLQPILNGLGVSRQDSHYWIQLVEGIITTATFSSLPKLFKSSNGDWWLEFTRDLVSTGHPAFAYTTRQLLSIALSNVKSLTTQGQQFLNQIGIILVQFHWNESPQVANAIRLPLSCICSTFLASPDAATEIIRRIISHDELQRAGYAQTFDVVNQIEDIWQANPDLAVEIYSAIFGYAETDDSTTLMAPSLIMPLRSNRKQDYKMAYYILAEKFPKFISECPLEATRALIQVIRNSEIRKQLEYALDPEDPIMQQVRSIMLYGEPISESADQQTDHQETLAQPPSRRSIPITLINWNGHQCRIRLDSQYGWQLNREILDDEDKMLYAWKQYLITLPTDGQVEEKWQRISKIVASENELTSVWQCLLSASSQAPEFYASHTWSLLLNLEILTNASFEKVVRNCVQAFITYLPQSVVKQIESTILCIPDLEETESSAYRIRRVKICLLLAIPESQRGQESLDFLASCDPELVDIYQRHDQTTASRIRRISSEEFAHVGDSEEPEGSDEESTQALADFACQEEDIDERKKDELYHRFANILAASVDPPNQEQLEQFDKHSGVWLNDRVFAASGFTCLAIGTHPLPSDWQRLLHQIANDLCPEIRFQVGKRIGLFLNHHSDFVWETLEGWLDEFSRAVPGILGVLRGTLLGSKFWWFWDSNRERAQQLLQNLTIQVHLNNSEELQDYCGAWLGALWFYANEAWAKDLLDQFIDTIDQYSISLNGALKAAAKEVLPRKLDEENLDGEETTEDQLVRERALDFIIRLLTAANQALTAYQSEIESRPVAERPDQHPCWIQEAVEYFDYIATQFHFSLESNSQYWLTLGVLERQHQIAEWKITTERILDVVLNLPHPHITFQLIEGLENLISLDVQYCLHWIRRITVASIPMGLTTESLAADRTVDILKRILAEHKTSLAQGEELRSDFVQILESYLQAKWPKAVALAVQIETIFR